MARRSRIELPGYPLHIIQRGNNRSACFFADADYRFYLDCLGQAARRHGCAIHAYVLMTNHVHLLVTPREPMAASHTSFLAGALTAKRAKFNPPLKPRRPVSVLLLTRNDLIMTSREFQRVARGRYTAK